MYTPHRDSRFEYVFELIHFIEENQCRTCAFSKLQDHDEDKATAEEYPMCYPIEGEIMLEHPMACLDDRGAEGVVCTNYRNAELASQAHPDQGRLL